MAKAASVEFSSKEEKDIKNIPEEFVEQKEDFIPTESVYLPSKGILYDRNHPLYKTETLEYRYMTALEEDILSSRALLRSGKAVDMVIKNCLVNKSVDLDTLVPGDKNAIMTALRVSSYGSEYAINVQCPDCGSSSQNDFRLDELEMRTLEIESNGKGANEFDFVLPIGEKKITFRFLTSGEESEITEAQEKIKKSSGTQLDRNVTSFLKNQIVAVDGNEDRKVIDKLVDTLIVRDSRALRKYIEENTPDIIFEQFFSCPNCGSTNEVNVPITTEFFWPGS